MVEAGRRKPVGNARARPPSMADVAALAGVSAQTVSRVINGSAKVDPDTATRVISAVRMINYQPNSAARALKSGHTKMIGIISFDLRAYGNARALEAIVAQAQERGYSVNVVTVKNSSEADISTAFWRLMRQNADGIIVNQAQTLDSRLYLPTGVPVVVVDGDIDHRYLGVQTDHAAGARLAVQHLLDLGHETVWHLAGPSGSFPARRRAEAWLQVLNEAGRPVPPVVNGCWSAESGYAAGILMGARSEATAVFAANDQMALGLIRALNDLGYSVPRDVSVVGFDDMPEAEFFSPPLTTVNQDFDSIGVDSVDLLFRQMQGLEVPRDPAVTKIAPILILRSSTAPPPQAGPPAAAI